MKKAAIALAVAAVTAAGALNISAAASAETVHGNDYSRAGYGYVSVGAADFLERVLGAALSASEREYLDTYSGFALKYNDKVAGKYVQSEFEEDSGKLTVTPSLFSYTAVNGSTVTWNPDAVNGEKLASGLWGTTITDDYADDFVTVSYNTSFTVSYKDVNSFINKYYIDAKSASDKLASKSAEYDRLYAEYLEDYKNYQKYLEDCAKYEKDLAAYNEYVAKLSEWGIQDRKYQNYLAECAEYEKEQKAYEEYLRKKKEYDEAQPRYQQYLTDKANYDRLYAEYLEKTSDPRIAKELNHIAILDYILTPVYINGDNARTLYNAVMGDSVTQVLSRLGEVEDSTLRLAKLIRQPIDDAEKATKNLRDIFTKLKACKTDEDKYVLYMATYSALKSNLNMLLQTLDYFFRNSFVRSQIQGYEGTNRDLQFKIMLAQLYTVCHALDNNKIPSYYQAYRLFDKQNGGLADQFFYFDNSYTLKDENGKNGITPNALLKQYGGEPLPDSNDAQPLETYIPIPEKPVEPEVVEKPEQPQRVQQPVAPEEVKDPGPAPKKVSKPDEVKVVKTPVEPVAYQPTEVERRLADDYNGGTLSKRGELKTDFTYYADCEVRHYFRNARTLTIAFYLSADMQTPEWMEEDVQAGSSVEYGGKTPTMTRRGYTCEHTGWVDANGNLVDINAVPSTGSYLKLYPYFTETANLYDVIWIVDGKEFRAKAAYDSIPDYNDTYEGVPKKADGANGRKYRFIGWREEITAMTDRTVSYTADFESTYFITFEVDSNSYVQSVWNGDLPVYRGDEPHKPSTSRYYYTFDGWNIPIVEARKDVTYKAQFDTRYILDIGADDSPSGATVELRDGMYVAECYAAKRNTFDLSVLADWAASGGAGIILQMSAYTVMFSPDEAYELYRSGACALTPSLFQTNRTSSGYGMYKFFVDLTGADGASYGGSFTMTAAGKFDVLHSRLFRMDGENAVETRYTYALNSITFSMRAGYEYDIYPKYDINVLSGDVTISVSAQTAAENDIITITVGEPPMGRFIERLYVLDADGNEIEISEDYTFIMPEGDVSVGVVCGYFEYTVIFKSEGKIIATRTYHYGDEVIPPQPVKAPDGEYSYKFTGWDKEIVPVTGDAEYNAIFEAELLPTPPAAPLSQKMQILIWIANHLMLLAAIAVAVFVLILTAIILKIRRRRKKRKIDKNRSKS